MSQNGKDPRITPEFIERAEGYLSVCTEREALVLRTRLGLDDGRIKTVEETAVLMDISCERVRQIERKAVYKHGSYRRVKKIRDFYICTPFNSRGYQKKTHTEWCGDS